MSAELMRLLAVAGAPREHAEALIGYGCGPDVVIWQTASGRAVFLRDVIPTIELLQDAEAGITQGLCDQLEAAREEGRQEVRETTEYLAGACLRDLSKLEKMAEATKHGLGSLQTGGFEREKSPGSIDGRAPDGLTE